eukprot:s3053_g9.t1
MVAPIPRAVASGDFLSDRQYSKDPDPLVAQSCEVALATIDWKHELLQVLKTVRIPEQAYLPDLSVFFNRFNISAEFYATQWFLTLFAYSLPFPQLLRVWDNFLCRGMKFIHRVGLALLKEAKSDLLGQNFDGAIERLRFLCQRSQLSPEALVSLAMEFKVTNRFLSDLEQAITSPSPGGSSRLPCCFLERDLDRGRTQCRFLMNKDGPDAPSVADADGDTFWEASLPAPRVPQDPLAPPIPSTEPPKEKLKAKSQLKSFAKKSQQVLSKVKAPAVLSRSSGNKHSKGQAPTDSILHLSDSERVKENSHPSRSSSVPSRGYQRCGASDAPSAWDASKAPEKAAASRRWMASLRSGRRLRPPSPRLSSRK